MASRRRRWVLGLAVAFIVMPLVEIWVIIQVGQTIGPWWTIALLLLDGFIGGWLVRREGSRAWKALRQALSTGTMPAKELADAALILIGGTLMLTPGFVTDAFGVLLVLSFTRPLARRVLTRVIAARLVTVTMPSAAGFAGFRAQRPASHSHPGMGDVVQGDVVQGDVVSDDLGEKA